MVSWTLVVDRVTSEDTDGRYSVTKRFLPVGYETQYHLHKHEEEVFYII